METTFISIHDLSLDARLLYVSNSIVDILGYSPEDVVGRSCWEYFHPDEIPFARAIHGRGVQLDKAAVLNYCQIKNKYGFWIGCECVFTIVHDVLVASTSIYRRGMKSQKRATEAPIVRHLFTSSPRDPRYHMLSYISSKFFQEPKPHFHEPRAALFLNRFTRTLTIMYATNGLAKLLGLSADVLTGKSFYYCIQENCLQEAIKCLESAKANDSIAYLRFWFRDPRQEDDAPDHDDTMSNAPSSDQDDDEGGVNLDELMVDTDGSELAVTSESSYSHSHSSVDRDISQHPNGVFLDPGSRSSSDNSTGMGLNAADAIFDPPTQAQDSSSSSISPSSNAADSRRGSEQPNTRRPPLQIELEAVVSCSSDGLVVILRSARPFLPSSILPSQRPIQPAYANGLFASPWAAEPIMPNFQQRTHSNHPAQGQFNITRLQPTAAQAHNAAANGPAVEDFMRSIRDVAVFAWSLTGINGSLAQYARGAPSGESQPPGGLPIWDQDNNMRTEVGQHGSHEYDSHTYDADRYWSNNHGQTSDAWQRGQQPRQWNER